jgi:hypothetical protein
VKASTELLDALKDISNRISQMAADAGKHEFDPDALADLTLARKSIDNLVDRVHRLVN